MCWVCGEIGWVLVVCCFRWRVAWSGVVEKTDRLMLMERVTNVFSLLRVRTTSESESGEFDRSYLSSSLMPKHIFCHLHSSSDCKYCGGSFDMQQVVR